MGQNFAQSAVVYNIYAAPVCSHVAQFLPFPRFAEDREREGAAELSFVLLGMRFHLSFAAWAASTRCRVPGCGGQSCRAEQCISRNAWLASICLGLTTHASPPRLRSPRRQLRP
eukprot:4131031-Pyramimonas_sp.AAC.1